MKKYKHDQQDGSADKVLTHKPDNLSSVPRTHTEEGEKQFSQIVLISTHASWLTCTHTYTCIHRCVKKFEEEGIIRFRNYHGLREVHKQFMCNRITKHQQVFLLPGI